MLAYLAAFCLEVLVPCYTNENMFSAFTRYTGELPLQVASGDRVEQIHVSDIRRVQFRVDLTY
jgi:hypothetical protein